MENPAQPGDGKRSNSANEEGISSDRPRSPQGATVNSSDMAHPSSPDLDPIHEQRRSASGGYGANGPEYEPSDQKDATFSKSTIRETTPDYQMHQQKSEGRGDIEEVHEGQGFASRRFGRYRKQIRMAIHAAIFILFTG
jgi:hypothetical protein